MNLVEEGIEVGGDVQAGLAGAEVASVPEPAAAEVPPGGGPRRQVVPQRLLVRLTHAGRSGHVLPGEENSVEDEVNVHKIEKMEEKYGL